jgi:Tfp pilus assembly protein PilX
MRRNFKRRIGAKLVRTGATGIFVDIDNPKYRDRIRLNSVTMIINGKQVGTSRGQRNQGAGNRFIIERLGFSPIQAERMIGSRIFWITDMLFM